MKKTQNKAIKHGFGRRSHFFSKTKNDDVILSEYEKIREKNIKERKKAFKDFKLDQLKSDVAKGSLLKPKYSNTMTIKALEAEFSFISKSLDDPKKVFCQICKKTLRSQHIPKRPNVQLSKQIELHTKTFNHRRNINPAEFVRALEVEFPFISTSLECSDKMFCKICKVDVMSQSEVRFPNYSIGPNDLKQHKNSRNHRINAIFSEFPFVSESKNDRPYKKNAFCKICNSEFKMFIPKPGTKKGVVPSPKLVRDHENSKEHKTNLGMVHNAAQEVEFPSISKSSTDPNEVAIKIPILQLKRVKIPDGV